MQTSLFRSNNCYKNCLLIVIIYVLYLIETLIRLLRKWFKGHFSFCEDLLSNCSQFLTFVFQSHVWRSRSKASPVGHLTDANLVTPLASELKSHLNFMKITLVRYYFHAEGEATKIGNKFVVMVKLLKLFYNILSLGRFI